MWLHPAVGLYGTHTRTRAQTHTRTRAHAQGDYVAHLAVLLDRLSQTPPLTRWDTQWENQRWLPGRGMYVYAYAYAYAYV